MVALVDELVVDMLSWLKSLFTSHSEMEASEFIPRELGPGDRFLSKSSGEWGCCYSLCFHLVHC